MRTPLVVRRYPEGPRVWLLDQRIHHGATGLLLVAAMRARHRRLTLLGLALILHDRRDWKEWLRIERSGGER